MTLDDFLDDFWMTEDFAKVARNKKCADCTAHCGYEPTAVEEATSTLRGMFKSVKLVFQ